MATTEELAYLIRVNDRDLKTLKQNIDTVNKAADDDLGRSSKSADSHLKRIGGAATIASAALGGALVIGLKKSVDAAVDAQRVQKATEVQLRSLGISYDDHAAKINNVINSTSQLSALDDEDLQQSFTRLVPATHSVSKALDQMQLAADIARARNISLDSATNLVIRANTGSAGALRRLGITLVATNDHVAAARRQLADYKKTHDELSPAMEKHFRELIAQAQAADKSSQAVKNLDELHRTFAGSAKSYGESAAGAQDRYKVAVENVEEAIGGGLLPVLTQLLNEGTKVLQWTQNHTHEVSIAIGVIAGLAAVVVTVNALTKAWTAAQTIASVATKAWSAAQWLLNAALDANPIGIVVIALAALGAALVIAWTKSDTFRQIVTTAWDDVRATAVNVFNFLTVKIPGALEDVLDWARRHWPEIAVLISGPFAPLVALATNAFGVRSALEGAFREARNFVGDRIDDMIGFLRGLPGRAGDAIQGLLGAAGLGPDSDFRRAFRLAADFVSDKLDDIVGFFRNLPGRAGDAVRHGAGDLKDSIVDLFGALPGWAKKILGISSPSREFEEIGQNVVEGFIRGIRGMAGELKSHAVGLAQDALDAAGQVVDTAGNIVSKPISFIGGLFGGGGGDAPQPNVGGGLISVGHMLQSMGFQVGENPFFGGVHPVHAPNSYHYLGRAIDVNWPGGGPVELQHLRQIFAMLESTPHVELLIEDAGTANQHLHLAMERGGVFNRAVTFGEGNSAPEVVMPLGSSYGRGVLTDALVGALTRAGTGGGAPLVHIEQMTVRDDHDPVLIGAAVSRALAVRR